MAKIIATRMLYILANMISHKFIKGKSIYDNILAVILGMEYAQFTKNEFILLYLDVGKAYNHIIWSFVLDVLKKFGFGS